MATLAKGPFWKRSKDSKGKDKFNFLPIQYTNWLEACGYARLNGTEDRWVRITNHIVKEVTPRDKPVHS